MPPVEDHEVHELTRIALGKRYGCHNRGGFAPGYHAPDRRYRPDGTFYVIQVFIPHKMSTACRYDLFETDPRCEGCNYEKDTEHAKQQTGR